MKIRKWFINRPIQTKLNIINVIVVLAALIPIIGITLGYEYFAVRQENLLAAEIQADIIGDNAAAALAFSDHDSASEILGALHSSPSVKQAALFLPDRTLFAQYVKPGQAEVFQQALQRGPLSLAPASMSAARYF